MSAVTRLPQAIRASETEIVLPRAVLGSVYMIGVGLEDRAELVLVTQWRGEKAVVVRGYHGTLAGPHKRGEYVGLIEGVALPLTEK